ncbi:MAG TPA: HEAT repeat domain-containing protein [Candidatus Angelobacter sp.]|nr:HEAT repeat domain-containing protein [Candidatus Angelobacter sp.]
MSALRKADPVEQALDRVAALKNEAAGPSVFAELRAFLKNRSNLVVAKAAKGVAHVRATELVPDLVATFHRLMQNPAKLDKGCAATTEIVNALYELDYVEPEIYLQGIHHVQMEGSFGPPVDAAAKLRASSALALARTVYPAALDEVVSLLVDEWPDARIGAVRALAVNGGPAGALLLKLKILTGESEPDVLAECFSGLLTAATERSLRLIESFAASEEIGVAEAALLALGSSRLPEALDLLKARWERTAGGPLRKIVLLAIGMIRSDAAVEFLLALLAGCSTTTAKDVLAGLAVFRDNEKIRRRVESVVARRNEKSINETFDQQF